MIAARCVDLYLEQRNREAASSDKIDIDGRLVAIVERMFERYSCCSAFHCTTPPHYHNLYHCNLHHMSILRWAHTAEVRPRRCFADGQFEQAVGIALEARRLDKLEQTIKSSPDMVNILTYSLQVCQTLVISREFRQQVSLIPALPLGIVLSSWVKMCTDNWTITPSASTHFAGVATAHQIV